MNTRNMALWAAGVATLVIAAVHVAAIFIGPQAFDYLDAHELAVMTQQRSRLPVVLTLGVVAVLVLFALYAFSGAGALRRLPKLRAGLLVIGGVFTFRGTGLVYFGYLVAIGSPDAIVREIGFSLSSLVLGLLFLWGRGGLSGE